MKRLVLFYLLLAAPVLQAKQRDSQPDAGGAVDKKGRPSVPRPSPKAAEPAPAPVLVIGSVTNWQAQAEAMYPSLRSPDSSFSAAFEMACRLMREQNPAFFVANDWPLRLAETVARSMKGDTTLR